MHPRFLLPLVLLAGCAPWMPPKPDPYAALRGHDAYGLVVSVEANRDPDMRLSTLCAARDTECDAALGQTGRFQYAKVRLSGAFAIERAIILKGGDIGDIVRLRFTYDGTLLPTSVETAARVGRTDPKRCGWVDGSPQENSGGIVCNGWSYQRIGAAK